MTNLRWWVTMPPLPGERIEFVTAGAVPIPGTGLPLVGGVLVLTDSRLYHGPLDTRWTRKFVSDGLDAVGGEVLADAVVGWVNRARAVSLADIVAIEPCHRSSVRITTRDRTTTEFAVGAGRLGPVWSANNVRVRDDLIARVRARLHR